MLFTVIKGDRSRGERGRLKVWDGNALKLGCDDGGTTLNIIKKHCIIFKKKRKKNVGIQI